MENAQNNSQKNTQDTDELWKITFTYIKTVVDTLREPFLILDEKLKVVSANETFYAFFQVTQKETEQKRVYDLGNGQWDIPQLKTLLEDILPKNTFFKNFEVEHEFPKIGKRALMLNARRIYTVGEQKPIMLLAMEDITRQKLLEQQLKTHTETLTSEVTKQTAELATRVKELEEINNTMVGRELKMIELKSEIETLKKSHE